MSTKTELEIVSPGAFASLLALSSGGLGKGLAMLAVVIVVQQVEMKGISLRVIYSACTVVMRNLWVGRLKSWKHPKQKQVDILLFRSMLREMNHLNI